MTMGEAPRLSPGQSSFAFTPPFSQWTPVPWTSVICRPGPRHAGTLRRVAHRRVPESSHAVATVPFLCLVPLEAATQRLNPGSTMQFWVFLFLFFYSQTSQLKIPIGTPGRQHNGTPGLRQQLDYVLDEGG
jgi:hypothetical protein